VVCVTARSFILGSVAILILLTSSGCYTVFQKGAFDGKPEAAVSSEAGSEFSGDMAFMTCGNDRWSYYLFCPWWEESIFLSELFASEDAEVEEEAVEGEEPVIIVIEPPPIEHIIVIPTIPVSVSDNSNSNDTPPTTPPAPDPPEKPRPTKPSQQTGPGGRR
jgi:hypothetical protein